jgi:hypothetical protein
MASLYQRGQARGLVMERLARGFRREVAPLLGVPRDAPPDELARAAARRSGVDADRLARVLRECEQQGTPGGRPKQALLLWAASELDGIRKQVLGGR